MTVKGCEVCSGHVRPLDDQSVLGYCENCGIVYVLKERMKGAWDKGTLELEAGGSGQSKGVNEPRGVPVADDATPAQASGSYWRCPDCGMEIRSDNDSDLGYAKREHVREYHPNRSSG